MNYFICTPSYNENSGGAIVLHRLCHLINNIQGCNAYLVKSEPIFSGKLTVRMFFSQLKWYLINRKRFKVNYHWNTPVWSKRKFPKNSVVIYPEIINGNPLKINNVVRWFLHQPGYHTGEIDYSTGELYFKFNSAIDDFEFSGSSLSREELKVIYYPIDIYNMDNINDCQRDIASCHMIRKGKDKSHIHSIDSVQVDGLTHDEMAKVFRRSKKFISYDDYTAYSIFAVLCGCESIVVPGINRSIDDWYPNESDRYGIAYGLSNEQKGWARDTCHYVHQHIVSEHEKSQLNVERCVGEIESFFRNRSS
ncbi:WavQ [Erwinia sp. SLM-02]|uniref:WavQ n=1 Tax=Erwinia sp. SLM-02 TaxID=3020057 RepID=UPI00307FE446